MLVDLTAEKEAKPAKIKMREMRLKRYLDREETLSENMHRLYGIIIRQCTPSLCLTIKAEKKYDEKSKKNDSIWLLETKKNNGGC